MHKIRQTINLAISEYLEAGSQVPFFSAQNATLYLEA